MPTNSGNVSTLGIVNSPQPSKEAGQRSMRVSDAYFTRIIPGWSQPSILTPGQWRSWVASQPVAVTCIETMISNISDLDWKITPRKSDMRDELKGTIDHYEKFLRNGGYSGLDWVGFLEWFMSDLNILPFGTGWELGRKGDTENGRVMWLEPLDGGTLYPTNNKDTPVIQYYNGYYASFPKHAIARAYMSPRPEIERRGWGVAPPEKVFLAMEMLARGDRYYANLLLDIPPAGVFDLGDITWEDANTWIESFRTFTQGGVADGFKIPVLAEHTGKVQFIPLGKAPNDIMYDRITLKYAAYVAAGFGMSLSDIGLSAAGGDTLAGSIRGEQKTNRTGKARNKGKIKYFIESIIPSVLQFDFIDTDGERLSMLGRARLASATAFNMNIQNGTISSGESRLQQIQDGLFTISMPEEPPKEAKPTISGKPPERPGSVGSPQPPSLGGDGEMKKSLVSFRSNNLDQTIESIVSIVAPNVYEALNVDDPTSMKSAILESVFSDDDKLGLGIVLSGMVNRIGEFEFDGLEDELESILSEEGLTVNTDSHINTLKSRIQEGFSGFIGKAIVYNMTSSDLLTSPDNEDGFANFSQLAEDVKRKINESLSEYISAHVGIEIQNIVDEMRSQEENLPEPIRVRSIVRTPINPISVVVNPPNISMPAITVNAPEKASTINIESPIVNVTPAPITIESPTINMSVPERTPDTHVINIPEQVASNVNMTIPAPIVNLSIPEQIVNVSPTPITIENNIQSSPKIKRVKGKMTVKRDPQKNIEGNETTETYEYEE